MRYEFVGKKIAHTGKTLWEIVGNLKNFGVGRLVKRSSVEIYPGELCFFKILEVQPLPPSKKEFKNRQVLVWVTEIFRDRKIELRYIKGKTHIPKFRLVSKIEEEELLQKSNEIKPPVKNVKKYCYCPPLYKKLWEAEGLNETMPKISTEVLDPEGCQTILLEDEYKPEKCSLYKYELTVDEMYKEIVRLKKIIKQNRLKQ